MAYEKQCTIEHFAQGACQKKTNYKFWDILAKKGQREDVYSYLKDYDDEDFPDLEKNRHIYVFTNGTLITKNLEENGDYVIKFYPHGEEIPGIDKRDVASKFFNLEYPDLSDVTSPETWLSKLEELCPNFINIMRTQEWSDVVIEWACIFIGRCLYERGDLDNFQVDPYWLGVGGSGKSTTLQNVIAQFFESCDVGTIPNNCERKYVFSHIVGKLFFFAPEVKKDFCMEQGDFQCMISSDTVVGAIKHGMPHVWPKFNIPGAYAGNELPDYGDNSGSISRRLLTFRSNIVIDPSKVDTSLPSKLRLEIPAIMGLTAMAYLNMVNKLRDQGGNIWHHAPQYFKQNQREVMGSTHALQAFLEDCRETGKILFRPKNAKAINPKTERHYYILAREFRSMFMNWCKETNQRAPTWNADYYNTVFQREGITISSRIQKQWPPIKGGEDKKSIFFLGIGLEEFLQDLEESKMP